MADLHLPVRPGEDAVLLAGMLRVILEEGLYDAPFVETWATGREELAHAVAGFTDEMVRAAHRAVVRARRRRRAPLRARPARARELGHGPVDGAVSEPQRVPDPLHEHALRPREPRGRRRREPGHPDARAHRLRGRRRARARLPDGQPESHPRSRPDRGRAADGRPRRRDPDAGGRAGARAHRARRQSDDGVARSAEDARGVAGARPPRRARPLHGRHGEARRLRDRPDPLPRARRHHHVDGHVVARGLRDVHAEGLRPARRQRGDRGVGLPLGAGVTHGHRRAPAGRLAAARSSAEHRRGARPRDGARPGAPRRGATSSPRRALPTGGAGGGAAEPQRAGPALALASQAAMAELETLRTEIESGTEPMRASRIA